MSKKNGKTRTNPSADPTVAVADWRALHAAADQLADVDTTTLAQDPAANPRTLEQRIAAADAVSRAVLAEQAETADDDLAAARRRRRARAQREERALSTAEAAADRAAATLTAIDTYEQADNPAASSLELHEADPRIRRMLVGVSLAGSAASALGIGAWAATSWSIPIAVAVGVLAELLLTVPVILLLTFQGLVRTHNKSSLDSLSADAQRVLTIMLGAIGVLLLVSVGLNVAGIAVGGTGLLGVVGIVGAVIALGASAASWGTTTVIRAVIRSNTAEWRTETWEADRQRLEATAAGAFIPEVEEATEQVAGGQASVPATVVDVALVRQVVAAMADEQVAALADRGTAALQAMLDASGPGADGTASATPGGDGGHPLTDGAATPDEQPEPPALEGNRLKVWQAIEAEGAAVSNRRIATLTELSRDTVRKHRIALEDLGYVVFSTEHESDSADQ